MGLQFQELQSSEKGRGEEAHLLPQPRRCAHSQTCTVLRVRILHDSSSQSKGICQLSPNVDNVSRFHDTRSRHATTDAHSAQYPLQILSAIIPQQQR
jgi:hypothetical protein